MFCFTHPRCQLCILKGLINKQWLNPKCWHSGGAYRPLGRLTGWLYTRGLNESPFRGHRLHAASFLLEGLCSICPHFQNPRPNFPQFGQLWACISFFSGTRESLLLHPTRTYFGNPGVQDSQALRPTHGDGWAASRASLAPWYSMVFLYPIHFSEDVRADNNSPPSLIQQR